MSFDAAWETERLIRDAGACPELSTGLRERVIAGSVRTRANVERRLRWDHTLAVCGLLVWLGIFIRQQAMLGDLPGRHTLRVQLATVSELTQKSFSGRSESAVVALSGFERHPEWSQVKAARHLRALKRRVLRRCFGC